MNLFTRQEQTRRHRKSSYGYQRGQREGGEDRLRVWDEHIHTTIYKIDKQQGPIVQHRELYSISCNNL